MKLRLTYSVTDWNLLRCTDVDVVCDTNAEFYAMGEFRLDVI